VGAASERRVWTDFPEGRLHPNLFVFLVGPPGVGKSVAMRPIAPILRKSQAVTLSPNDVTKQGLLDCLAGAAKGVMHRGRPMDYHFLAVRISELSNFMSQYDGALAGLLTELYDCEDINEEKKRGHDKGMALNFPGLSMLVGTATQNLGNTIKEDLWGSGFMARVILVFSAQKIVPKNMFKPREVDETLSLTLLERFTALKDFVGPMHWEPAAQEMLQEFRQNADLEAPLHNRLTHYATRRWMHLTKLCMIAALNDERMNVRDEDVDLALSWLLNAESQMTEVFKDMVSHEDGNLHEEMRHQFFQLAMKTNEPVTQQQLYEWCRNKMGSHSVERFVQIAVASGNFKRVAGTDDEFVPQMPRGFKNLGVF